MEMFLIYLAMQVEGLIILFGLSAVACIAFAICNGIASTETNNEKIKTIRWKRAKTFAGISAFLVFLAVMTPKTETIAAMYIIPTVADYLREGELPGKAMEYMNLFMDQQIMEMQKKIGSE